MTGWVARAFSESLFGKGLQVHAHLLRSGHRTKLGAPESKNISFQKKAVWIENGQKYSQIRKEKVFFFIFERARCSLCWKKSYSDYPQLFAGRVRKFAIVRRSTLDSGIQS
jgi:hypothetical protein